MPVHRGEVYLVNLNPVQGLCAARRGLSALLPVWELEAALGLARGRGGRFPGETTVMPRCGSHGDRSPWEPHRGITVVSPGKRPPRPLEGPKGA